jgi:hypothetical protein
MPTGQLRAIKTPGGDQGSESLTRFLDFNIPVYQLRLPSPTLKIMRKNYMEVFTQVRHALVIGHWSFVIGSTNGE